MSISAMMDTIREYDANEETRIDGLFTAAEVDLLLSANATPPGSQLSTLNSQLP